MEKPKTLREQLEDDFKKFKKFIKEKKNYIFWIIVMFITIQFTDVLSLGASWDEMVKQNPYLKKNGTVLRGGAFWEDSEETKQLKKNKQNIESAIKPKKDRAKEELKDLKKQPKKDRNSQAIKRKTQEIKNLDTKKNKSIEAATKKRNDISKQKSDMALKQAQDRQAIRDAKKKDKKKNARTWQIISIF